MNYGNCSYTSHTYTVREAWVRVDKAMANQAIGLIFPGGLGWPPGDWLEAGDSYVKENAMALHEGLDNGLENIVHEIERLYG